MPKNKKEVQITTKREKTIYSAVAIFIFIMGIIILFYDPSINDMADAGKCCQAFCQRISHNTGKNGICVEYTRNNIFSCEFPADILNISNDEFSATSLILIYEIHDEGICDWLINETRDAL